MMDLIQFLDNIRPAYSGLQWPIVTVWNPTNMSGPDCLSQSHNLPSLTVWLYCRVWRPGPAGPRPPHVRPLQPGGCRPETGVGQLGLAALQPPGPLPLLPINLGRGRHAGGASAHQRFQGESGGVLWSGLHLSLLFRWEPWEGMLELASLIIISMEEGGNTNAKCVHR